MESELEKISDNPCSLHWSEELKSVFISDQWSFSICLSNSSNWSFITSADSPFLLSLGILFVYVLGICLCGISMYWLVLPSGGILNISLPLLSGSLSMLCSPESSCSLAFHMSSPDPAPLQSPFMTIEFNRSFLTSCSTQNWTQLCDIPYSGKLGWAVTPRLRSEHNCLLCDLGKW